MNIKTILFYALFVVLPFGGLALCGLTENWMTLLLCLPWTVLLLDGRSQASVMQWFAT